jgi:hypothetical protein
MLFYLYSTLYDAIKTHGIHARVVWNKHVILCSLHDPLPKNLSGILYEILAKWLSDALPDLPREKVYDQLTELVSETPTVTVQPIMKFRHFWGTRLVIDMRRLKRIERDTMLRQEAKIIMEVVVQTYPFYKFLSVRDVILLDYSETGKSISSRQATRILNLLEREKVIFRNGHLRTKGRELNLKKAREFLRTTKAA